MVAKQVLCQLSYSPEAGESDDWRPQSIRPLPKLRWHRLARQVAGMIRRSVDG